MKKIGCLTVIAALLGLIWVLAAPSAPTGFTELGYFKDDDRRRAMLYHVDHEVSDGDIALHADGRPNTPGQITFIGYVSSGCAEDGCRPDVTLADSFPEAMAAIRLSDLDLVFFRMPNGQLNRFDCDEAPEACAP